MVAKKIKRRRIDWNALKLEFMSSNINLNQLRMKHKISYEGWFYKKTKGWNEERQITLNKGIENAKEELREEYDRRYKMDFKLWEGVLYQTGKILTKYKDTKKVIKPSELNNLTSALDRALKSRRLIYGDATEISREENLHLLAVKLIQQEKNEQPTDITPRIQFK